MQPTAQAVGEKWNQSKPQRGEREATTQSPEGRASLAHRFSGGKNGIDDPSPGGVCVIARWSSEKWTSDIESSREAAQECSPRRKPWVKSGTRASPNGAKEKLRHSLRRDDRSSHTHSRNLTPEGRPFPSNMTIEAYTSQRGFRRSGADARLRCPAGATRAAANRRSPELLTMCPSPLSL